MKKGFTITEVLIVITVIGIIATIVIVSYNGLQQRANDASVQSDLEGLGGQLEAHRVRSTPKEFPRDTTALGTLGIKAAKNAYKTTINLNFIYCINTSDYQSYALVAESRSGTIFMMTQDGLKSNTFVESDLVASLCGTLGMGLVSSGMFSPNTWQTWVGGN